jgi:hypothetical protein
MRSILSVVREQTIGEMNAGHQVARYRYTILEIDRLDSSCNVIPTGVLGDIFDPALLLEPAVRIAELYVLGFVHRRRM